MLQRVLDNALAPTKVDPLSSVPAGRVGSGRQQQLARARAERDVSSQDCTHWNSAASCNPPGMMQMFRPAAMCRRTFCFVADSSRPDMSQTSLKKDVSSRSSRSMRNTGPVVRAAGPGAPSAGGGSSPARRLNSRE
eukprot:4571326-Prymnesium_polylepis.1